MQFSFDFPRYVYVGGFCFKMFYNKYIDYRYSKGNGANTIKKNLNDLATVLNFVKYKGDNIFTEYAKRIVPIPVHNVDKYLFTFCSFYYKMLYFCSKILQKSNETIKKNYRINKDGFNSSS